MTSRPQSGGQSWLRLERHTSPQAKRTIKGSVLALQAQLTEEPLPGGPTTATRHSLDSSRMMDPHHPPPVHSSLSHRQTSQDLRIGRSKPFN